MTRHPTPVPLRRLGAFSALLAGLLAAQPGCTDGFMMAVGGNGDAGVTSSFGTDDPRVRAVVSALEAPVLTVRPEPRFVAHPFAPSLLRSNREWKTLVLVLDASRPGPLADPLRRLLTPADTEALAGSEAGFRVVRDVWATGQAVLLVHTRLGAEAFERWLSRERGPMLAAFEDGLATALEAVVLAPGRQTEMERYLERHYGFHLSIPKDYVVAEDPAGRVVRVYRVLEGQPPRFLLVHWGPSGEMPPDGRAWLELRDRLGELYSDGDRVDFDRSAAEPARFQGRPAVHLRGIYQNWTHLFGGPFRSYGFNEGDRYYLIDTAVFNPQGPPLGAKLPYLREVLALARTFRTRGAEVGPR